MLHKFWSSELQGDPHADLPSLQADFQPVNTGEALRATTSKTSTEVRPAAKWDIEFDAAILCFLVNDFDDEGETGEFCFNFRVLQRF